MSRELLGVDVGGSSIKLGRVRVDDGAVLGALEFIPTPLPATPEAVLDAILAHPLAAATRGPLGLAFPAVVKDSRARTAANVDRSWLGVDAAAAVTARCGRACAFLNDADAAGLAEMRCGAGRGLGGVVLMLTLGTGIGTAPFVDGRLVPNSELGHVVVAGLGEVEAEEWASARCAQRSRPRLAGLGGAARPGAGGIPSAVVARCVHPRRCGQRAVRRMGAAAACAGSGPARGAGRERRGGRRGAGGTRALQSLTSPLGGRGPDADPQQAARRGDHDLHRDLAPRGRGWRPQHRAGLPGLPHRSAARRAGHRGHGGGPQSVRAGRRHTGAAPRHRRQAARRAWRRGRSGHGGDGHLWRHRGAVLGHPGDRAAGRRSHRLRPRLRRLRARSAARGRALRAYPAGTARASRSTSSACARR